MSREPQIYRQYAYLRVTGYGPSDSITKILKILPDEEWSEGEVWEDKPKGWRRTFTNWKLNSGLDESAGLNEHIEQLLMRINRKRQNIMALHSEYTVKLVCVSFNLQAFSFELDFEHQKQLTQFGISIWFDAYSYQDPHELISDLRQQLQIPKIVN